MSTAFPGAMPLLPSVAAHSDRGRLGWVLAWKAAGLA
jgi:hypothetical protein